MKKISKLRKEINRLLSKGMSNIYLTVTRGNSKMTSSMYGRRGYPKSVTKRDIGRG